MSWCRCGNHGPEDYKQARNEKACHICWLQKWHPDKMPPSKNTYPFTDKPIARYLKCEKCGADMSKRIPCAPCGAKVGKASVDVKVCPNCS